MYAILSIHVLFITLATFVQKIPVLIEYSSRIFIMIFSHIVAALAKYMAEKNKIGMGYKPENKTKKARLKPYSRNYLFVEDLYNTITSNIIIIE